MAVSLVNVLLDSRVIMVLTAWILMNVLKTFVILIRNNNQLNASISKVDGNANVLLVSLHQLISLLDHSELILISIVLILMNVFLILVASPMATQQSALTTMVDLNVFARKEQVPIAPEPVSPIISALMIHVDL